MKLFAHILFTNLISLSLSVGDQVSDELIPRRGKFVVDKPPNKKEPTCSAGCKPEKEPEDCRVDCKEKCKCVPKIDSHSWTTIREANLVENTVLVCDPNSRVKKLQRLQSEYQYNITCSGIITKRSERVDELIEAQMVDRSGRLRSVPINVENYSKVSLFSQGSESYWSRAVITSGECAGDVIVQYGHWVVDNPLDGCTGQGVNHWTGVFYKAVIKGEKCCATCYLLQSAYALVDRPLNNF